MTLQCTIICPGPFGITYAKSWTRPTILGVYYAAVRAEWTQTIRRNMMDHHHHHHHRRRRRRRRPKSQQLSPIMVRRRRREEQVRQLYHHHPSSPSDSQRCCCCCCPGTDEATRVAGYKANAAAFRD
jgi:hypothetical protein